MPFAQRHLEANLKEKYTALQVARGRLESCESTNQVPIPTAETLYLLIQQQLFHSGESTFTRAEIAHNISCGIGKTRTILNALIEQNLVSTTGKRPIYYGLTKHACALFGIPDAD
jgi:hypothetical protein